MKVRIVVPGGVAEDAPRSGGDLYDAELARALCALGHDAAVCATPERDAVNLFDGLGAPHWAPRLASFTGVKVALLHQPADALGAEPAHVEAERALLAQCVAVHFVSARAQAGTRASSPSWVAPPGIDHFTPLTPAPRRRIVANGHLWAGKGALEALDVLASLPGDWHLDWLGALDVDAAYTQQVMGARAHLGLESRVTFHGRVPRSEVARFLSQASVFLCTSRYESWGLALAEALRAGVPVVSNTPAGVFDFAEGRGVRGGDLRAALMQVLSSEGHALREEARAAGQALPTWADCAAITARELEAWCARE